MRSRNPGKKRRITGRDKNFSVVVPKRFVKGALMALFLVVLTAVGSAAFYIGTDQIISKVSTGTAPFVISSTTKVTNLNADLLDGLDSSALQDAPGSWTCTVRTSTSSSCVGTPCTLTATVSCTGSEKVITGGCSDDGGAGYDDANGFNAGGPTLSSRPTSQGWQCKTREYDSFTDTITAYANCCTN